MLYRLSSFCPQHTPCIPTSMTLLLLCYSGWPECTPSSFFFVGLALAYLLNLGSGGIPSRHFSLYSHRPCKHLLHHTTMISVSTFFFGLEVPPEQLPFFSNCSIPSTQHSPSLSIVCTSNQNTGVTFIMKPTQPSSPENVDTRA